VKKLRDLYVERNLPFPFFCFLYEFRDVCGVFYIPLYIICENLFPVVYMPFATLMSRAFGVWVLVLFGFKREGNIIVEMAKKQ